MTIYLDLLFILNFIYDSLLLLTVSTALKRKVRLLSIFSGALVGGISTFIILIPINKYILLMLKIISSLLMLLVAFKFKNIKYFFNNIIYLYMCSVILAGFLYFLKIEFKNFSYIISLCIAPIILYLYIKEQKKLKKIINLYRNVVITLKNNKELNVKGFIDSGNTLKDPITNKYIILINKKKLKGIYNIRSPMYVPVHTINKSSLLPCIGIKSIKIDEKIYTNYLLGLVDNLKIEDDNDCLLNYHILEE